MIIGKTTETILSAVRDYLSRIFNGRTALGYEKIALTSSSAVVKLTIPTGATSAEITVETSDSTTYNNSIRYTYFPNAATGTVWSPGSGATTVSVANDSYTSSYDGIPLGDFDTIEILGFNNLQSFTAIVTAAAVATANRHLKVIYFR